MAKNIGLSEKIAKNMIGKVIPKCEEYINLVKKSLISDDMKIKLIALIEKRISIIA